jgi:hypothetical protein
MPKAVAAQYIELWTYFWMTNLISVTIEIELSRLWKDCTGVLN